MTKVVVAQLAALKSMPVADLKQRWADLFGAQAPPYNRRFLESRLGYRIQELAFGGLSRETQDRLKALAADATRTLGNDRGKRAPHAGTRPIIGTKLIREWKGVEHCVTVRESDFEYLGQPYRSLSSIARLITQTRWNGLVFFGLKRQRAAS